VVVDDLDVPGVTPRPAEADPPLVVDSDAVLALSIALERLEPVSRRDLEILERLRSIQDEELPQRASVKLRRKASRTFSPEEDLGGRTAEAPNHESMITPCVNNVKRYG